MCGFKSGIVTQDGRVIAPVGVDSHNDIFEQAGVEDDGKHAVPVEFYPSNYANFFKPDKYALHADCDIVPKWFTATRRRDAEQQMRKVVRGILYTKPVKVSDEMDTCEVTELPRGISLESDGDLDLTCLKRLSKGTTLKAEAISLDRLTSLPEGTRLKAKEIWLVDLKSIAKGVRIEAQRVYWQSEDQWHTPKVFRRLVAKAAKVAAEAKKGTK